MAEKRVYVIYRDGEVFKCYLDREYRNDHLTKLAEADKERKFTWAVYDYPITERVQ